MGDGFYRSKDTTNRIKVLKEKATKEKWMEQCFTSPPTQPKEKENNENN